MPIRRPDAAPTRLGGPLGNYLGIFGGPEALPKPVRDLLEAS